MIGLDAADLVVIASEVLGCDTGAALAQADITAADDALRRRARQAAPGRQARFPLRRRAGRGRIPPTPPRPRPP